MPNFLEKIFNRPTPEQKPIDASSFNEALQELTNAQKELSLAFHRYSKVETPENKILLTAAQKNASAAFNAAFNFVEAGQAGMYGNEDLEKAQDYGRLLAQAELDQQK